MIGAEKGYALTDEEVKEEARKMAAAMRGTPILTQNVVPQIQTPNGVVKKTKADSADLL